MTTNENEHTDDATRTCDNCGDTARVDRWTCGDPCEATDDGSSGEGERVDPEGTTIETITDEQIEALRTEAGTAGDGIMHRLCTAALCPGSAGYDHARAACVEAIRDAEMA